MSTTRAMLEGRLGTVTHDYRLYRSTILGEKLEELPTVEGASWDLSNFRDHTWEITLPMRAVQEFDLLSDWVMLEATVSAGNVSVTRPFGLYYFQAPKGENFPFTEAWDLSGQSPEAVLMDSTAERGYSVPTGTGVLAAVKQILTNRFVPANRIRFPPTSEDLPLTSQFFADPFQDQDSVRWLRICNALLAAGGFYALWTGNDGKFETRAIQDSDTYDPDIVYGTEFDSDRVIVGESIPFEYDDETFANRVVVYSGDPNQVMVAVAENHDTKSRVSYEALGRWIQKEPIEEQNLLSPKEGLAVARAQLRKASGMNLTREIHTVFDPRVGPRQIYGLEIFDEDGTAIVTGAEWPVVGVSASMDLSPMEHTVHFGVRI